MLERYRYTIAAVGLALLFMPRLPGIGSQVNGAFLAVKIGSIQFQPAEFAKIAIIIFLASYLNDTREVLVTGRIPRLSLKHFGPLLLVWGAAMLMLVFIRDLGSSLMFFGGFLALLYVATARHVARGRGLRPVPRRRRLLRQQHQPRPGTRATSGSTRSRASVVDEEGYQIAQGAVRAGRRRAVRARASARSLLELPSGGTILPAPHTDLVYAVITNELGLFGAAALVLVYLLFAQRGFKTAMVANDGFSKLLATGLTAVFALQVFVIVGGVDASDPAHRGDAAVRLLRRQLDASPTSCCSRCS